MQAIGHKPASLGLGYGLQPPRGGRIQMPTGAVPGQAVVAGGDRLENPQVRMLDGDHVIPGRQGLPGSWTNAGGTTRR